MAATSCPSCRAAMARFEPAAKVRGTVELDLCFSCQGIWLDSFESQQIAPDGIVELFTMIHAHRDDQRLPLRDALACPRCEGRLVLSFDLAKSGRFNYYRCGQNHGRFTSFGQFMIEKGFVRQLTGAEIDLLKVRIGTVRCNGCGAPVDIRKDTACPHCRAPIAVLDPDAAAKALAGYRRAGLEAAAPRPEALADAILAAEKARGERTRGRGPDLELPVGDLILSGIEVFAALLAS